MNNSTLNDAFNQYLDKIEVTQEIKDKLEKVRMEVRKALTEGIGNITEDEGHRIRPRFMTQGSARYKTQNMPCFPPAQQIDYDYGCYLPLSYHEDDGDCKPERAAKEFFKMVGEVLSKLASTNKWTYKEKKSCCRLVVSQNIHFDVPLYSVPDQELKTICDRKLALECRGRFSNMDSATEEKDLEWDDLPTNDILLAENDGNGKYSWRKSDPRLLNQYFEKKTDNDRAIYRTLKGWRDFIWSSGKGPSSIFLMSLAEKANSERDFSEDIPSELAKVLKFIRGNNLSINQGDVVIDNPADATDFIRCQQADYQLLQQYATNFDEALNNPFANSLFDQCPMMRAHLGKRFPILSDCNSAPKVTPTRTVRAG